MSDPSQCSSSSSIPSIQWDDDTIRDFASQFVPDDVFGSHKGSDFLAALKGVDRDVTMVAAVAGMHLEEIAALV